VASHGTGLYLANLAAAVVDWRLSILEIDKAWFSYALEKVHTDSSRREQA